MTYYDGALEYYNNLKNIDKMKASTGAGKADEKLANDHRKGWRKPY